MKECPKCKEILGNDVEECFKCGYNFKLRRVVKNDELKEKEIRFQNEQLKKQLLFNTQYEYKIETFFDNENGTINDKTIELTINKYAKSGWKLIQMYNNEVGKSQAGIKIPLIGYAINATICQTVLVFERIVKPAEK